MAWAARPRRRNLKDYISMLLLTLLEAPIVHMSTRKHIQTIPYYKRGSPGATLSVPVHSSTTRGYKERTCDRSHLARTIFASFLQLLQKATGGIAKLDMAHTSTPVRSMPIRSGQDRQLAYISSNTLLGGVSEMRKKRRRNPVRSTPFSPDRASGAVPVV
jgi:hypothetical protein